MTLHQVADYHRLKGSDMDISFHSLVKAGIFATNRLYSAQHVEGFWKLGD